MKTPDSSSSLLAFILPFFLILLFQAVLSSPVCARGGNGEKAKDAVVLFIRGAIGPAVSDYVIRGINKANDEGAALVILQIDTPGGLDYDMRAIIKAVLASQVPVVSYVSPAGSRAARAGTHILYASHIAAMAPATNLGAATPIKIGGLPNPPGIPSSSDNDKPDKKDSSADPLERKIINDAVACIKGLTRQHGRNEEWAEKAVREAVSLTAEEALNIGVIDLIAEAFIAGSVGECRLDPGSLLRRMFDFP